MKRLALVAAAFAAAATLAPVAQGLGCPEGWFSRPTGQTNPVTGAPITYCWPKS